MKTNQVHNNQTFGLTPREAVEYEYEYDAFIGKIVRKIKQKQPIRTALGFKKNEPATTPVAAKVNAEVRQAQLQQQRQAEELEKKNEQLEEERKKKEELEAKAQQAEQQATESKQSDSKKMLLFGLIAVGALALIGGSIVLIKTRQNQLNALQMQSIQ